MPPHSLRWFRQLPDLDRLKSKLQTVIPYFRDDGFLLMRPAIFLDRDGVLIENRASYVRTWEDVAFFDFTFQAMRTAAAWPHAFVIVSNQAGVGRGVIALKTAQEINDGVAAQIRAHGGRIERADFCPHHPNDGCACRKPAPGMLLAAARDLEIDLARSWMIGDNITDMQAGRAAGARCMRVRTGLGELQPLADQDQLWFETASTLAEALHRISTA
jgi:D-glycero-D-manno-heptose 1,7-bisphosphate phosphatase